MLVNVRLETACGCTRYMIGVTDQIAYSTLELPISNYSYGFNEPVDLSPKLRRREFRFYGKEYDMLLHSDVIVMRENYVK